MSNYLGDDVKLDSLLNDGAEVNARVRVKDSASLLIVAAQLGNMTNRN